MAAIVYQWNILSSSATVNGKTVYLPLDVIQFALERGQIIRIGAEDFRVKSAREAVALVPALNAGIVSIGEITLVPASDLNIQVTPVNRATTGDSVVAPAVAGKKAVVYGVFLYSSGNVTVTLKSGVTAITGVFDLSKGVSLDFPQTEHPLFSTAVGQSLVVTQSANVQLSGFVYWRYE